ncbi:MAG: hypothetical protein Q9Q13_09390 [Acidobacteriota bacterium]|nr:hypothetical protein [Acidobacteriota bacterium]
MWLVGETAVPDVLEALCATGRLRLLDGDRGEVGEPLSWDAGPPWEFHVEVRRREGGGAEIGGTLVRDDQRRDPESIGLLFRDGLLLLDDAIARYEDHAAQLWLVAMITGSGMPVIAEEEVACFTRELVGRPGRPPVALPEDLAWEKRSVSMHPRLSVRAPLESRRKRLSVPLQVFFEYGDRPILAGTPGREVPLPGSRQILMRDPAAERRALRRLATLGYRPMVDQERGVGTGTVDDRLLAPMIAALLEERWLVEAQGKRYRHAGNGSLRVSSGIDWFEVRGEVEFDDQSASLPALIAALAEGSPAVRLGDGSYGILPSQWLEQWRPPGRLGPGRRGDPAFFPHPGGSARRAAGGPAPGRGGSRLRPGPPTAASFCGYPTPSRTADLRGGVA